MGIEVLPGQRVNQVQRRLAEAKAAGGVDVSTTRLRGDSEGVSRVSALAVPAIVAALARCGGSVAHAARALGVPQMSLRDRISRDETLLQALSEGEQAVSAEWLGVVAAGVSVGDPAHCALWARYSGALAERARASVGAGGGLARQVDGPADLTDAELEALIRRWEARESAGGVVVDGPETGQDGPRGAVVSGSATMGGGADGDGAGATGGTE